MEYVLLVKLTQKSSQKILYESGQTWAYIHVIHIHILQLAWLVETLNHEAVILLVNSIASIICFCIALWDIIHQQHNPKQFF